MDLDLQPGWEKKALIILGVITLIVIIYAFNPFNKPHMEIDNGTNVTVPAPAELQSAPPVNPANSSLNITKNLTNTTGNFQISSDQAKKIATDANPGYTAGSPTKANIMINNNNTAVWIVPLMKGSTMHLKIYVDAKTGIIVGTEEVRN
jgi:hypothetical protein